MIRVQPDTTRNDPMIPGLEVTDDEWILQLDEYRQFISETTGIKVDESPSAEDCYRIGNRLEAFIDKRRRAGEWTEDLVKEYPDVDNLEEITWLARFFRTCHQCTLDA